MGKVVTRGGRWKYRKWSTYERYLMDFALTGAKKKMFAYMYHGDLVALTGGVNGKYWFRPESFSYTHSLWVTDYTEIHMLLKRVWDEDHETIQGSQGEPSDCNR